MALRVALADDRYLAREALRRMLGEMQGLEVVATCGDAEELRMALDASAPDLVVTGARFAAQVRDAYPDVALIAVGGPGDAAEALALFEPGAGGRAYLLEQRLQTPGQLQAAIETVASGGALVDAQVVEELMRRSPLAGLSAEERATLAEMARGASNAAIAATLGITQRAVERHIHGIFDKLDVPATPDVNRRVRAVVLFLASRGSDGRGVAV